MDRSLLESINDPADLRKLPLEKLPPLAEQIRDYMIDTVSRVGGHLAPSLGAVELAIALHYVFDTPRDKLIWDVGHQSYPHKILTGRREAFVTLRQYGGMSGFPRVSESPYDSFSVGHASTSISAGLGMAIARDLRGEKHRVVVVIGDGALSGGLAFEGLNNLGTRNTDLLVVLNDNEMSISRNVGALSRYLTRVLTDKRYLRLKDEIWRRLGGTDIGKSIRGIVSSVDDAVKHVVIPGKLFEDMGVRYLGPVDGHNITAMVELFRSVQSLPRGPVLVHVQTKKGKGYRFAEDDATRFHGIGSFQRSTGSLPAKSGGPGTYSDVFGSTLVEIGKARPEVVAVTAAMPDGTKLSLFRDAFPGRFFDVGIAEGHAVTFAAGLAQAGMVPVVAIYSTFLQRAYDQIVHDVALDNLHVVFGVDRAGLVGDDGPTHHGAFDLSFLRTVPNATILAPRDENELRRMLFTAVAHLTGPVFIRYPRGAGRGVALDPDLRQADLVPEIVHKGKGCAIVSVGHFYGTALALCEALKADGRQPALVDARVVKPLDAGFYGKLFASCDHIVTLEANAAAAGFGSGLLELLAASPRASSCRVLCLGYPDRFVPHGTVGQLMAELGLDAESVIRKVKEFLAGE